MSYEKILDYDSDDDEFVRGFEAGRIYDRARHGNESSFDEIVHTGNLAMMGRIADATNRSLRSKFIDRYWTHVFFG
jgi:hypothetical protein